jgi:NAD-dependent SIR2 family protein deacetylase
MNDIKFKQRIVVVCGAGISTAAGVPDFKTLYSEDKNLKKALSVSHCRCPATHRHAHVLEETALCR